MAEIKLRDRFNNLAFKLVKSNLPMLKACAHSFKRFTSRLLKVSFSLSMHLLHRMNVHA